LLNSGILPSDARISDRGELEIAVTKANGFLRGLYTDFGLVLFTEGDPYTPNDLPAKLLAKDLRKRGIKIGSGKLIPFGVLSLEENGNSAYGGVFRLNEKVSKDNVLDLANFNWDSLKNEGLACADFGRNENWGSEDRDLGISSGYGRVVVVSGEATSQKILSRYSGNYQAERDKKFAEAEKEYQERIASLRVK